MTEYTPNDGDVRWQYVVKRMHDGATRTHAEQEYTRWLTAHDARVSRDAAREALDGLIDAWLGKYGTPETQDAGIAVRDYREMNYRLPEETP